MSAITELKVTEPGREDARKSASLLARAALRVPAGLFLRKATGEPVTLELSSEILKLLQTILDRIAKTGDLLLLDRGTELTPEQAGKILGVSRPIVYHRMDSGRLPYRPVGTHRRVRLNDVLRLRASEQRHRKISSALSTDKDELDTAQNGGVEGVTPAVARALELFAERIRDEYGNRLIRMVLFGSRSRGEANRESDVDVAVVLDDVPDAGVERDRLSTISYDVLIETGEEVQPWPVSIAQWTNPASAPNPILIRAIRRDGIEVSLGHDSGLAYQSR